MGRDIFLIIEDPDSLERKNGRIRYIKPSTYKDKEYQEAIESVLEELGVVYEKTPKSYLLHCKEGKELYTRDIPRRLSELGGGTHSKYGHPGEFWVWLELSDIAYGRVPILTERGFVSDLAVIGRLFIALAHSGYFEEASITFSYEGAQNECFAFTRNHLLCFEGRGEPQAFRLKDMSGERFVKLLLANDKPSRSEKT